MTDLIARLRAGTVTPEEQPAVADAMAGRVKVRELVWDRGIVDYAKPLPGMKYVACSTTPSWSWAWWLDGEPMSRQVHPTEEAAKAAAQADYAARIMAAIEVVG